MFANTYKGNNIFFKKSKNNPVLPIYSQTPVLFSFRLELFNMERRVPWVTNEEIRLLFSLFLY